MSRWGNYDGKKFTTGDQIKVARAAAGLTQVALAELVLANRVTVAGLELRDQLPAKSVVVRRITQALLEYPNIALSDDGILTVTVQ